MYFHAPIIGPFSNGSFWHMLKILLKTNSKCVENNVWLKCISKQMYFKTDKSNVAKQTISKLMYFKTNGKNQPNKALGRQNIIVEYILNE